MQMMSCKTSSASNSIIYNILPLFKLNPKHGSDNANSYVAMYGERGKLNIIKAASMRCKALFVTSNSSIEVQYNELKKYFSPNRLCMVKKM
jgi:hypothetical protein